MVMIDMNVSKKDVFEVVSYLEGCIASDESMASEEEIARLDTMRAIKDKWSEKLKKRLK
jgi:hypothetical protein